MDSTWIRTGIRRTGKNHRVAVSIIENGNTGKRAYMMDVTTIYGSRLYLAKVKSPKDFEETLEKILKKGPHEDPEILREDARQLVTIFQQENLR